MADVVDQVTRSRMMSGIRSKDTKPEKALRAALECAGIVFATHDKALPGRPDIVLNEFRAVIMVHGCFWHRHPGCRFATTPATRPEFWIPKLQANVDRDRRVLLELRRSGWRTGVVWECYLKQFAVEQVAGEIAVWLRSPSHHAEFPGT